jgi:hypothetical protein
MLSGDTMLILQSLVWPWPEIYYTWFDLTWNLPHLVWPDLKSTTLGLTWPEIYHTWFDLTWNLPHLVWPDLKSTTLAAYMITITAFHLYEVRHTLKQLMILQDWKQNTELSLVRMWAILSKLHRRLNSTKCIPTLSFFFYINNNLQYFISPIHLFLPVVDGDMNVCLTPL